MRQPVNIQVSHPALRWRLKQAAAQRRVSLRALATEVLSQWLADNGFGPVEPEANPTSNSNQ